MSIQDSKLYRSRTDRIIFGVAGGVADYFHFDATIIRIIFILLAFNGFGIIIYLILALVIPLEPAPGQPGYQSAGQPSGQSQSASSDSSGPATGEPFFREEKVREFAHDVGAKAKEMAEEFRASRHWESINAEEPRQGMRNILGLIIVFFGILLLLKEIFPFIFGWFGWGMLWPLLFIFLGLVLLIKHKQ